MKKVTTLFVMALFILMPLVSFAQQSETVVVGTINPALYKVAGDLTIQSFTLSPSTINTGDVVMSVIRWVSVSGGVVKVKLPYPGGAIDSTIINAIAGTVYETRFWHSVSVVGTHTLVVSVIKSSETATATATLVVNGPSNQPPVASNVTIIGSAVVGQSLTGNYTYSDVNGDLQGVSTFKWYRNNIAITGATTATYTLTTADLSATIKFEVTPVAQTGASPGLAVQSSAVGPVVNTNQPPVIDSFTGIVSLIVGQTGSYNATTHDPDGNQLTNIIEWLDGSANYVAVKTGTTNGQLFTDAVNHTFNTIGTYLVKLTTTDINAAFTFQVLTVVVNPLPNQRPEVKYIRYNGNFPAPGNANITVDGLDYEGGLGKLYVKYEYSNVSIIDSIGIIFPVNLQVTFVPTPRVFSTNVGVVKCTVWFKDNAGAFSLSTWFTFVVSPATGVEEFGIPSQYSLSKNYPNPFNPTTTLKFTLPNAEFVNLTVYDVLGKKVVTLINENKQAGYHTVEFDAGSLSSGIYLYKLTAGKFSKIEKMVLMK